MNTTEPQCHLIQPLQSNKLPNTFYCNYRDLLRKEKPVITGKKIFTVPLANFTPTEEYRYVPGYA
jgi:hypothetical protein